MKFALPLLVLGVAIGAGAANASAPVWSDKVRAALAQQEAATVEAQAKPAPSSSAVVLTIGANGKMTAVAPTKPTDRAEAEPARTTPTGGL